MHPQLQFRDTGVHHHMGERGKRSTMPNVKFNAPSIERDGDYWNNVAQDTLRHQLHKDTLNRNVAKNIIMFLGDGMSIPTLAATRIYMGGEDRELSFEKFPFSGLSKVKCWNKSIQFVVQFSFRFSLSHTFSYFSRSLSLPFTFNSHC